MFTQAIPAHRNVLFKTPAQICKYIIETAISYKPLQQKLF